MSFVCWNLPYYYYGTVRALVNLGGFVGIGQVFYLVVVLLHAEVTWKNNLVLYYISSRDLSSTQYSCSLRLHKPF